MRLLAIEQTRSPQGKLRLRFDSGEAMLVLPVVVADLSLRPGMDIPDAARASLEAAAGSASAKERSHSVRRNGLPRRAGAPSAPEGRIARERQAGRRMARRALPAR